jgi:hypothetical protein
MPYRIQHRNHIPTTSHTFTLSFKQLRPPAAKPGHVLFPLGSYSKCSNRSTMPPGYLHANRGEDDATRNVDQALGREWYPRTPALVRRCTAVAISGERENYPAGS